MRLKGFLISFSYSFFFNTDFFFLFSSGILDKKDKTKYDVFFTTQNHGVSNKIWLSTFPMCVPFNKCIFTFKSLLFY